jgi:hypothetical protein
MILLKAIVAMVLALGALTTTFSSFGVGSPDPIPHCFPCGN